MVLDGAILVLDSGKGVQSSSVIVYAADLEGTRARVLDHGGTLVRGELPLLAP